MSVVDDVDTIVIGTRRRGGSTPALHVPDGDGEPLCDVSEQRRDHVWIEKDLDVYPPAWRDWCQRCIQRLKDEQIEAALER